MDSLCCMAIGTFAVISVIIYVAYYTRSTFTQPLFYSPGQDLRVSYDPNLYPTNNIINLASKGGTPWYL